MRRAIVLLVTAIGVSGCGGGDATELPVTSEAADTTIASELTTTTPATTTTSTTQAETTTTQPTTTTTSGVVQYEWHQATDQGSHAVLSCTWTSIQVECDFEEEPGPGATPTVGEFSGDVIDQSMCLEHMVDHCVTAIGIAQGRQFYDNEGGVDFVIQATIAVQPDGTMIHSFDSGRPAAPFYCPWFRTFQEALAGDGECTFA